MSGKCILNLSLNRVLPYRQSCSKLANRGKCHITSVPAKPNLNPAIESPLILCAISNPVYFV